MSRENPKDKWGMGKTTCQGLIKLKKMTGWITKRKLLRMFFQPLPLSHLTWKSNLFTIGSLSTGQKMEGGVATGDREKIS